MSIGTVVYCIIQWKRLQPVKAKHLKRADRQNGSTLTTESADGVQLVGICRIKGHDNMAYASSQENVAFAQRLETVPKSVVIMTRSEVT